MTPYLAVDGAAERSLLQKSLWRQRSDAHAGPNGTIGHAESDRIAVMLADEFPDMNFESPARLRGTPVGINIIPNVDGWSKKPWLRRETACASPVEDHLRDRSASLEDPFGHLWHVSTPQGCLPRNEKQAAAMAAGAGKA